MKYNSQKTVMVYCLLLIGGVLAFDTLVDVSIVAPVAYVAAVLASLSLNSQSKVIWITLLCASLTIVRVFWVQDHEIDSFWNVMTNRFLALFAILVTAALGLERKRAEMALRQAQNELEQRVIDRTQELAEANNTLVAQTVELDTTNKSLVQEIEDRVRAEEANRRLEDRTRIIIDHAIDAIVTIDDTGAIVTWNPRAEELFGWKCYEVLGELLVDLIVPKQHRRAHRKGILSFHKRQQEAGGGDEAQVESSFLNQQVELTALNRDGLEFPVELSIAPIPWEKSFLFSGFIRDLRPEQQVERRARQAQLLAETIIDAVPEPIVVLDVQLNVQSANQTFYQLFDIEAAEASHQSIYEIKEGEFDFPGLHSLLGQVLGEDDSDDNPAHEYCCHTFGSRNLKLTARGVFRDGQTPQLIIVTFEDTHQSGVVIQNRE